MADDPSIFSVLELHRQENREQFSELRNATASMAKSVSDLTALVARVEERHISQDDGLKRIGIEVDDHEKRIRVLETCVTTKTAQISGGWKTVTVVATLISFAWGVIGFLLK